MDNPKLLELASDRYNHAACFVATEIEEQPPKDFSLTWQLPSNQIWKRYCDDANRSRFQRINFDELYSVLKLFFPRLESFMRDGLLMYSGIRWREQAIIPHND